MGRTASAEKYCETQDRLRAGVPFSSTHARYHDVECPLHPRIRPREAGPHCHHAVASDLRLSGRVRKLVQPDSRPGRNNAHLDRHGHRATPGCPTRTAPNASQVPVQELPEEALVFLLASRYCDSDRLLDLAWTLFASHPAGLGARPGYLRFRACAHRVQLSSTRAPRAQPRKPTRSSAACAATMPILPSPSAVR